MKLDDPNLNFLDVLAVTPFNFPLNYLYHLAHFTLLISFSFSFFFWAANLDVVCSWTKTTKYFFYYKAECGYLLFIALVRPNTSKDSSHKTRLILINRSNKCFR